MANHARVRIDNMSGIVDGSKLVSVKYFVGTTATAIDNGNVVVVGELIDGEREVRKATAPAKGSALANCVLLAAPEVDKAKAYNAPADFENKAGEAIRGYRFVSGNTFSVTKEAFVNVTNAKKNAIVELGDGTKFVAVLSATSGSTKVGTIIAVEGDFYVIEVA